MTHTARAGEPVLARLAADVVERVVENLQRVTRARFGAPTTGLQASTAARSEVRRLIRTARGEFSLWARCRGFVSLRSLRPTEGSPVR